MDTIFTWGTLSGLLIAISGFSYMRGVYRKTVARPVISAWGIWAGLGILFLLTYYDAGARMDTTLPAAWMGFINPLIIVILSIRYGKRGWTRLETWCVAICIVTVIVWQSTDSAVLGLAGAVIADSMGAIPQIKKCWTDPDDEPWFPWTCFCVGSAVNMLSIETWEVGQYLFPIYMTAGSFLIAVPIIVRRIKMCKDLSTT